ncbi:short chain dehydrogenase [Acidovorax sp. Root217]|uniref:short chain dehydrogenase n=1 Tax=Acidovorax sp. Root217 TaxID=1736492 RepID=UPI00070D05EC|nr:short chain dehydrogenase [Acidovorax sp. Root217]KRC23440.1 short-chain dehydrogenase [Acidovorax sp. Root217]
MSTTSKILLIGASGTIGQAVLANLSARHEVITVGRTSGTHRADFSQPGSVAALFKAVGKVDAIVSTAGNLHFGPLAEMTAEQFNLGLQDKLLGQVQLALLGQHYLNDGGSITLTSGIVGIEPIRNGANATAVNAAIDGFVAAAAIELPRGVRINAVSPTILTESVGSYGPFFPGFETVPAARAALAYQRSVEGGQTGRVYRVQ